MGLLRRSKEWWLRRAEAERDYVISAGVPSSSSDLQEACQSMLDDNMTSEMHHPGYVLVSTEAFERVRRILSEN